MGSNSLHLLVVEAHPDGTFTPLVQEKEMLRLGDVVSREGRLTDESVDAVLATVRRFRTLATASGADEMVVMATAALREADNGAYVVDRIEAETGVRVEVISGKDEARLIFGAVRASVMINPSPALCLDLGGGSLELTVGDSTGLLWSASVKLGVARLTAELVHTDPPSSADRRRLQHRLTTVLAPIADEVADLRPRMLIGTSGTLCDLARMAAARSGSLPTSVNQLTVSRADIEAVHSEIMIKPLSGRRRMEGLDARRADLIPAGSMLLVMAMELFGLDELTVSDWALREGMVLDAIGHHDPADWTGDQTAIRRSSVLGLCRRCNWDEGHGRQVARLATDLFDQTRPIHGLPIDDRELLDYAALLHDIGEHVSTDGHHKHTAYLIEHGRLRGFSPEEVAVLCCLGRFHRRGEPKTSFLPFAGLDEGRRSRVAQLTALLRLADGLDRSHTGVVDGVDVELRGEDRVMLHVHASGDIELELWGLRRKRELFERTFHRGLDAGPVTGFADSTIFDGDDDDLLTAAESPVREARHG
jgi:exopolyphosphatase/guanosine-5'-triphosphate,3'-diphosphate pyrophosphatase